MKKFKHKKERKLYQASFSTISTPYSYPYDIKKKHNYNQFIFPFSVCQIIRTMSYSESLKS